MIRSGNNPPIWIIKKSGSPNSQCGFPNLNFGGVEGGGCEICCRFG